jgi:hypothetical protein
MSKSARISEAERVEPTFDSVLDFLYYDSRRVGQFISQFGDFGLLQQIETTESRTEGVADKARIGARIGPQALSFNLGAEKSSETSGADSSKHTFDPFWTTPLRFLEYLEKRGLTRRNLRSARIGQLLLVRGRITILDMGLLKSLWKIPEAKENALKSAIMGNPGGEPNAIERSVNVFFQMVEHLPHAVQCILDIQNDLRAWALLQEDFIAGSSSDLALRYGLGIDGQWSIVGIVDALPADQEESQLTLKAATTAVIGNAIGGEIAQVAEIARKMGRPADAFGLTPLLIFRDVSG